MVSFVIIPKGLFKIVLGRTEIFRWDRESGSPF